MIARRLDLYIARRFVASLGTILFAVAVIVCLADYIEVIRRFGDEDGFTAAAGVQLVVMRAPLLLDTVLPFAFLFAALLTLLTLSRRLELVVARASGISVWGFLKAPVALALILGGAATFLLHPLAIGLKEQANRTEAELSGSAADLSAGIWFRQESAAGPSILHAAAVEEDGRTLRGVTAFVFDTGGRFREKATARRADYAGDRWDLIEAEVMSAAAAPHRVVRYSVATELQLEEVRRSVVPGRDLPVWSLPAAIAAAERTGLDPNRFRLGFHALIARPLFLIAMVAVAATVSLRLSRYGATWRLILAGVAVGFLLYVLTEIASDLGGNGIIDPVLAAWLPPFFALTLGATVLLHQEDG